MRLTTLIKKTFYDDGNLTKADYEKGRQYFIYEGSTSMVIFSLAGGAFLAGFANFLGADDSFNGILGAIPALAGAIQILSSLFFERLEHKKPLISLFAVLGRLLMGVMFLVPLAIFNRNISLYTLMLIYIFAQVLMGFVGPSISGWLVDLTPEKVRGKYLAKKDAVSLAFVTVASLLFGKLLDTFRNNNKEHLGFIVIGVVLLVLAFFEMYYLSVIREPLVHKKNEGLKLKNTILEPITNKNFRKVLVLFVFWNISLYIALPYFSVYMVTGLKLSYTYIMIMGLMSNLARVILVKYWGVLADSKSWEKTTVFSILALAICHFVWGFANKDTAYIIVPLMNILGGIAWGGATIAMFNIQFIYAPKTNRTVYIGGCAAYGGLIGFATTLLGSRIIDIISSSKITIFGFSFCNMQVVFLISGILLGLCSLYVHLFIEKKRK